MARISNSAYRFADIFNVSSFDKCQRLCQEKSECEAFYTNGTEQVMMSPYVDNSVLESDSMGSTMGIKYSILC